MDMSHQHPSTNMMPQPSSPTRKVRIKNATRIKNVTNTKNHYQQAKFPGRGQKAQNIRTSDSSQASRLDGAIESDNKDIKKSERIKIRKKTKELLAVKRRKEDLEDQASDASSISEASTVGSDTSNRKTPSSANRYVFKSKRLQELQEKMDNETTADVEMQDEFALGEIRRNSKDEKTGEGEICGGSDTERNSCPTSRRQSQEQAVNGPDDNQDSDRPAAVKKKRVSVKKTSLSRLQTVKNDDDIPSSSEDEDSCKPLSQVKKEQQKEQQEPADRVVKKVIKVVKKIRTKSGETKTKVVKIIKKIGVRKKGKGSCPVVTGRRRSRCGNCRGCRITDDCGECRWCK